MRKKGATRLNVCPFRFILIVTKSIVKLFIVLAKFVLFFYSCIFDVDTNYLKMQ